MANEGGESDYEEEYKQIVERDASWRRKKDAIKKELLGESTGSEDEIGFKITEAIETQAEHDQLLQSTISVFDPRGKVCQETGWRIFATEPLHEKGVRNADALIGNPDLNWAILVEGKTGLSSPGKALEQLFEAADKVREEREYLSEKTGLDIDNVDCVLCVPSQYDQIAADTIAQYENDGEARETVYIWRLNRFSGETLQIFENVETRSGSEATHDHRLSEFLSGEGVQISGGSEITPEFFPSSHLANIIETTFVELLWARKTAEEPLTTFTRRELLDFLTSQDNLLHYSAEEIGERIGNEILKRLLDHELIKPHDGDEEPEDVEMFEYLVDGRTLETIRVNLTEGYVQSEIDASAEAEAIKRTVEKFRDEIGGPLGNF